MEQSHPPPENNELLRHELAGPPGSSPSPIHAPSRTLKAGFWSRETFFRFIPAFDSLRTYSLRTLGADLVAGLTVAAVALPQAMAYALIAGLPPQYGLYTAIVMTTVGALFDSSKQLINGPTNAISIALLSALAGIPMENEAERVAAAVLMAFLIGAMQTGIWLLRLGDLTRYISHAVIVGFTLGAGVLLVMDQFKNLVGLRSMGDSHDHFLVRFWLTLTRGGPMHGWTAMIGLGTILFVLILRTVNDRMRWLRMPEFLIAVIVAAAFVGILNLDEGPNGVRVVGEIPRDLPGFAAPELNWTDILQFSHSAFALAVLGLLEAIAMAKGIAAQTGQKLDINQQCLSEGVANLAGSCFKCFPGSGSLTRSSINQQAGAVTQWSGVFSALAVAVTMMLFAPLARYIPRAALAGILMLSAWRMIDRRQLAYHLRATRYDLRIVLATAFSAVFISVEFCILIGIFLSFVFYVPRAARVLLTQLTLTPERVLRERVPTDPMCTKMLIYNLEGELFFGSAPNLEEHLELIEKQARTGARVVLMRLKRARNPDAVCLHLIDEFIGRLQGCGVKVLLCGVRRDLAKALHNTGLEKRLDPQSIFLEKLGVWSSTLDAVRHAYSLLNGDLCATCPRREELAGEKEGWYYMI